MIQEKVQRLLSLLADTRLPERQSKEDHAELRDLVVELAQDHQHAREYTALLRDQLDKAQLRFREEEETTRFVAARLNAVIKEVTETVESFRVDLDDPECQASPYYLIHIGRMSLGDWVLGAITRALNPTQEEK